MRILSSVSLARSTRKRESLYLTVDKIVSVIFLPSPPQKFQSLLSNMLSLKGLSILLLLGTVVVGKPQFGNPIREDDDYLDYMNVVPQDPQDEVRPANPYDFVHGVKDEKSGNDYSHKAASDGAVTRGEYRVVLPDGRLQIVRYQADKEHGYQADISYENATTDPPQSAEYEK